MNERTVATTIHGRYLTIPSASTASAPLLVGFHGYGEDAEAQLDRLQAIPGSTRWTKVSIQALHRFYQRSNGRVVASWMTRQDRELAIADNLSYISNCLKAVTAEWPTTPPVVFTGFSQGVAMAFRAAAGSRGSVAGVIAVGGDVPPDVAGAALARIPAVLIARGKSDTLYPAQQFADDEQLLRRSCANVRAVELNAGHEWSSDLTATASEFLRDLYP